MHFRTTRSTVVSLAFMLCCGFAARTQTAGTDARASEILNKARAALGGDAALSAISSLSGSGDFRVGEGAGQVSGDLKLEILFPDRLMRTMKWSPMQSMKVTSTEVMNGTDVWADSQTHQNDQLMGLGPFGGGGMGRGGRGGGGMGRGGRRSTGGGAGSPGANGPSPGLRDDMDRREMRSYFASLVMALLLRSPDSSPASFAYKGEADISGSQADILRVTTKDGLVFSLAIDRQTDRPLMAGYSATAQDASDGADVEVYFSEYRSVAVRKAGDVWLPYQITRTKGGQTVEDMHIKKFQINPHLNAKQFEQKS